MQEMTKMELAKENQLLKLEIRHLRKELDDRRGFRRRLARAARAFMRELGE
jgi:regulator of replication initiation timing